MAKQHETADERQILGLNFFVGDAQKAIERISRGGLLVVPAAPALKDIGLNEAYREALVNADMALTDSALMVLLWNLLEADSVRRLSGLEYMRELLRVQDFRAAGSTFWIMPSPASARKNLEWLASQRVMVPPDCVYVAPIYGTKLEDEALIEHLRKRPFKHVVIALGGGTQERLGLYIKRNLDYLPAIHCIGAAIAFLSGDQVRIPAWADKVYLGWLFRCVSSPRRYVPRYWTSLAMISLLWRYRNRLPPIQPAAAA